MAHLRGQPKLPGPARGDPFPVAGYLLKLKAALWARRNPDFVITTRTDSAAVHGVDDAIGARSSWHP